MREEIKELFEHIVAVAMEEGKDIRLEWKDYNSSAKGLQGALFDNNSDDHGVVLTVYDAAPEED